MVFKAFGVILLHFNVEKLNQRVNFTKKKKESGAPTIFVGFQCMGRVTGTTPIFLFGLIKPD
jgi:hypothetical protein